MQALTCSDNYDIVFSDNGFVSVETKTSNSLSNMLKLDFVSNDDWGLDKALGIHWISNNNDGILQLKNNEIHIVNAVHRKLLSLEGVSEVKEIEINKTLNRGLYLRVVIISDDGTAIEITKEV